MFCLLQIDCPLQTQGSMKKYLPVLSGVLHTIEKFGTPPHHTLMKIGVRSIMQTICLLLLSTSLLAGLDKPAPHPAATFPTNALIPVEIQGSVTDPAGEFLIGDVAIPLYSCEV